MGALNPVFLLAGLAIAVPIYLHLFQRHQTRRLSFPALRYLERTEREHARQIRFRQLLLMLLRVACLALVVGAGARLFFSGRGTAHPPTAVALILDNSSSSGLVVGERRRLDELVDLATRALEAANDEDRFWVIRAGEPWLPALPGGPDEAREAVLATRVSDGAGDLSAALVRARRLLETSELEHREIHLVSDLQASAFATDGEAPAGEVPVVLWVPDEAPPPNRALSSVRVGDGLPPLEGERASVVVAALEAATEDDTTHLPVRLVLNERIRGAGSLPPGSETTLSMPPAGSGWILGYVDADPDDLRADDRRYFAFRSRPAPAVAVGATPSLFLGEALDVLQAAGRLRPTAPAMADLLVAPAGMGLEARGDATAALVLPPADPTLLPALNRRLSDAGIPWSLEPSVTSGEARLRGELVPPPLSDVRVRERYRLVPAADPPAPPRTLGEVDGVPWMVEGRDALGRPYLLIGSPMTRAATSLPVSTAMLRFLDWTTGAWAGAGRTGPALAVGAHLTAPAAATSVRFPSGSVQEVDGTRTVRGTGEAGFYTFLAGDSVVSVVALNPPIEESRLARLPEDRYGDAIGATVVVANDPDAWDRAVYRARQGPELWRPFLVAVLLLLVAEAMLATSGASPSKRSLREPAASEPMRTVAIDA